MRAIEQGILTPTTKGRLRRRRPRLSVKKTLEAVTRDLKATVESNPDEAQRLLSKLDKFMALLTPPIFP